MSENRENSENTNPYTPIQLVHCTGATDDGLLSYSYKKKAKYGLKLPERNEEILAIHFERSTYCRSCVGSHCSLFVLGSAVRRTGASTWHS